MGERVHSKVLIVDDEKDIRFLFDRILRRRNLKPDYACNVADATVAMNSDKPSMIFLDNNLPDGQGIDFIPYIKCHFPETRVIMVTANDTALERNRAFEQGADGFLSKPLSLDLINRTLDTMPL